MILRIFPDKTGGLLMLRKGDVQTTTKNNFLVTGMLNVSKSVVVGIPIPAINLIYTLGQALSKPCLYLCDELILFCSVERSHL